MITKQEMFLDLMGQTNVQFIIPVYQRAYAWTDKQCEALWRDINRAGRINAIHFIGTLLYMPESEMLADGVHQMAIIDGQQRTATCTLVLIALREYLKEHPGAIEGVTAEYLDQTYLHSAGGEENGAKLILSRLDRDTMISQLNGTPLPEKSADRVVNNLEFFQKKMAQDDFDAEQFWRGMQQLLMIDAELTSDDHAQYVFDSMNSKGMPLTTADFVRNRFLISEDHAEQTRLYEKYWLPIEMMFDDDEDATKLNNAIKGWLAVNVPSVRAHTQEDVYAAFKHFIDDVYEGTTEEMMQDLQAFARMYSENFKFNEVKAFRSQNSSEWKNEILSKMPHRFSQGGF